MTDTPGCVELARDLHLLAAGKGDGAALGAGCDEGMRRKAVIVWGLQQGMSALKVDMGQSPALQLGKARYAHTPTRPHPTLEPCGLFPAPVQARLSHAW